MATITVKNIPDALYEKLKESASANRRSINSQLIHCLEAALAPTRITADERIRRARKLRSHIKGHSLTPEDISDAIREGRP